MFELKITLSNKMEIPKFENYHERDQLNCYLFLLFQSNILFSYDGINYMPVSKNSVIVYTPSHIQAYKSNDSFFLNSFAEFNASPDFFDTYELPLNTVISLSAETTEKIVKALDEISFIHNTNHFPKRKSEIPDLFVPIFKAVEADYRSISFASQNPQSYFNAIRERLLSDPVPNVISKLAKTANLNESYFCKMYKKFFGISPGKERNMQIVKLIEDYLTNTNYPLEKITELCGFANVPSLIKLFKQYNGVTPHKYRKGDRDMRNPSLK